MILNFLQIVFAFVLVLAPLVFIHELGHFLAAKAFRIGVPVFSLGFGPRLWGFRRAETDYRLSLVPLGGYVRLAGDEADEERTGAPEEFLGLQIVGLVEPPDMPQAMKIAIPGIHVVGRLEARAILLGPAKCPSGDFMSRTNRLAGDPS